MPALLPDHPKLSSRLAQPGTTLVVCLCADWCRTCHEYRERFDDLADRLPENHVAVWLDIEDHAEWLDDDLDVEDFPTLWVGQAERVAFFGVMLPHIGQLERLLQRIDEGQWPPQPGPELYAALRGGSAGSAP